MYKTKKFQKTWAKVERFFKYLNIKIAGEGFDITDAEGTVIDHKFIIDSTSFKILGNILNPSGPDEPRIIYTLIDKDDIEYHEDSIKFLDDIYVWTIRVDGKVLNIWDLYKKERSTYVPKYEVNNV